MATENNGGAAEWASNRPKPLAVKINDDDDRLVFDVLFSPTMQMEGLITPTDLHYVVQHFGMPDPVRPEDWSLTLDGEVKSPLKLSYEELRRFPAPHCTDRNGVLRQ